MVVRRGLVAVRTARKVAERPWKSETTATALWPLDLSAIPLAEGEPIAAYTAAPCHRAGIRPGGP